MGKGASDTINATQQSQLADSDALVKLAQGQAANADKLFSASFPGFEKAESYYTALSSGDPYAISRAIAPVAQQADQAAGAAKGNILRNGPAGGEKNLALDQVDVNRGAEVSKAASSGYTGSFNALASLAGQGVGESQSATGLAVSGLNSATTGFNNVGNQAVQEKGNTLGAFGGLLGDATTLGAAGIGASKK